MTVRAILRWLSRRLASRCTRCGEKLEPYGPHRPGAMACMACDFGMHVVERGPGWTHYESPGGLTKYTVFHDEDS